MLSGNIFEPHHNDYILNRIRYHAGDLARTLGLGFHDVEEVEQDLAADLSNALRRYDAQRSSLRTFVCRVIRRRCLALRREGWQRRERAPMPLSGVREATVDRDRRLNKVQADPSDAAEQRELMEKVRVAVASLPECLREIATLLMDYSQAETARRLGVSEPTILRARRKILAHFAAAGLEDLL